MKTEYEAMKVKYTEDADRLIKTNEQLQSKINDAQSYKHNQTTWIEHFKEFADISELDRRAVVNLIKGIKIKSKTDIEITFPYQSEYESALALTDTNSD